MAKDELVYIVRHTAIHGGFGEDGLAQQGEIFTESEIREAGCDFDRLIRLEAIDEPTPRELRNWREAQAAAQARADALQAEIEAELETVDDLTDEVEETGVSAETAAAELEDLRAENARLTQELGTAKTALKTATAAKTKAEKEAKAPGAGNKAPKNPNPGTSSVPEVQAANVSGNQTSENEGGTNVPPAGEGDQNGDAA